MSWAVSHFGNRSVNLPRDGKEDGVASVVRQDRHHRHSQRNGAGRTLETAGSTGDLKNPRTEGLPSREIYAIASPREIDRQ